MVAPTGSAVVTGVLSKVAANNNSTRVSGVSTTGTSLNVTIVDSEASSNKNLGEGVLAYSSSGHAATAVMLRNVTASNNEFGLNVGANAILRVGHSVVTWNASGLAAFDGGTLNSYGDNDINGNTSDNTGELTPLAMH